MTGRSVMVFRTGTELTSSVLRVAVSKVRIPRSQRITRWLPPSRMYSAACRSSFTVALMPLLRSTGRWVRPSFLSSAKFCMLRAPTWRTSAFSAMASTSSGWRTSVTTGRPHGASCVSEEIEPLESEALEGVRELRGLKAPPRIELRAVGLDHGGGVVDLRGVLHRARPEDERELAAADGDSRDVELGVVTRAGRGTGRCRGLRRDGAALHRFRGGVADAFAPGSICSTAREGYEPRTLR